MSAQPRSQVLIRIAFDATTQIAFFTSPAGCVTLVKSAYITNGSSGVALANLGFHNPSFNITIASNSSLAANTTLRWDGWFVLNPGDQIFVNTNVAGVSALVSGAVLLGPPPFPPNV